MTLDELKDLRAMHENHMELPADKMAELFDIAEATFDTTPKPKAKAKAEPVAEAPAEAAKADTLSAQG